MNRKKFAMVALTLVLFAGLVVFISPMTAVADFVESLSAQFGHIRGQNHINAADSTLLRRYVTRSGGSNTFQNNNPSFVRANATLVTADAVGDPDVARLREYLAATDPTSVRLGPAGGGITGRRYPRRSDFPPGTRFIAFTFDDGPNNIYTVQILDILKQHDARATFYVNPFKFDNPTMWHPSRATGAHSNTVQVIQRMIAEGHYVDNHQ